MYDLDLWLMTLEIFSVIRTHMMNIREGKFNWNHSAMFRHIVQRKTRVMGRTDNEHTEGRPGAGGLKSMHTNCTTKQGSN